MFALWETFLNGCFGIGKGISQVFDVSDKMKQVNKLDEIMEDEELVTEFIDMFNQNKNLKFVSLMNKGRLIPRSFMKNSHSVSANEQKSNGYEIGVSGHPTLSRDAYFLLDIPINLTNIKNIVMEFDVSLISNSTANQLYLMVDNESNTDQNHVAREAINCMTDNYKKGNKRFVVLNVSELEGQFFIKWHLRDYTSNSTNNMKLLIKNLYFTR